MRLNSRLSTSCALLLAAAATALAQPRTVAPDRAAILTPFERDTLASASYGEAIAFYRVLAKAYPDHCRLDTLGATDSGELLYHFTIGQADGAAPEHTFFVNNGIHAGEPCGVDASMLLARDYLASGRVLPKGYRVSIIPAYNVGGMLRRGQDTRANQVGPRAHGFRGNARNLDLNRDFLKQDSRNARLLTGLLAELRPDVFVDTHTTNGADYAYALTVIATQPEKLGPVLGDYMRAELLPALYGGMAERGHLVSPYVYSDGVPQEAGLRPFIESGRYSSGYAALHHGLAFITEAHMLKPFATRVRATESFLQTALAFWLAHAEQIAEARAANAAQLFASDTVALSWRVDSTRADTVAFRGYTPVREPSRVTGAERLRYDRTRPTTTPTVYHAYAAPDRRTTPPRGYVVPLAYRHLLERPDLAQLTRPVPYDASVHGPLERARVLDFATSPRAYEGHHLHYDLAVDYVPDTLRPGERALYVALTPDNAQLLLALFEPQAPDSFFAWGAFDAQLQQKEHYSAYVFEETAAALLDGDAQLRAEFAARKASDEAFRQNPRAQLDFLYARSEHYEGVRRNPVLRVAR